MNGCLNEVLERSRLQQIHDRLSPEQFEKLVYSLLDKMGFTEVQLTGKSGDGGKDMNATWSQTEVPGLRIDLDFVIQAKRFAPNKTLNPRIVRELRGSLISGQWGLLITTAKVTAQTREEGLRDPSRVVSVIDGGQLLYLCQEYEVGFRKDYQFDASFLDSKQTFDSPPTSEPPKTVPADLANLLQQSVGEKFERIGRTPIYRSPGKVVIARWSQHYPRSGQNYWYGLTAKDIAAVNENGLTHFAYVCDDVGTVMIPVQVMMAKIKEGLLGQTLKDGYLRLYHISLAESEGGLEWMQKAGKKESIQRYFFIIKQPSK